MKEYITPEVELIEFECEDIVTDSWSGPIVTPDD